MYFSFFFFSSRRRHTRCLSDWSSDVCSSDLTFVQSMGRGLTVVGGNTSYALGGYTGSLLEQALPLSADAPFQQEIGRASCRERVEESVAAGRRRQADIHKAAALIRTSTGTDV